MALLVVKTSSASSGGFHIDFVKPYEVPTGLDVVRHLQRSRFFADFPDPVFLREVMAPAYETALERQRPSIDGVAATLLGMYAAYDRIILPQRNTRTRSSWCVSVIEIHFLLPRKPPSRELDDQDIGILQLLASGAPTREIADRLNMSPRTIEHRIESLKSAFGARNIAHLVSLWISAGSRDRRGPVR
jgi:DNA-binding CsgD family transcriptional regulator